MLTIPHEWQVLFNGSDVEVKERFSDPVPAVVLWTLHAGRFTSAMGMSADQWHTFARGADYVARRVRDEAGPRTMFHQHIGMWVETPTETEHLLDMTNPDFVGLCFNTAIGGLAAAIRSM